MDAPPSFFIFSSEQLTVKKLGALIGALLCSLCLYIAVFLFVERPLTIGGIGSSIRTKTDYANTLGHPKVAIWAGSNGRYSHRCEAFTAVLKMPCVNFSMAVGIGIDFQLLSFEKLLEPGDILYMPLEYSQYRVEREEMESGAENDALIHSRRDLLWTLGPRRIARAWGYFSLPYFIHGVIETSLAQRGFQRRGGAEGTSAQGDQIGHTAEAGLAYREFLETARFDTTPLPKNSYALAVIEHFLERARRRGVIVVGGLPTTPDRTPLDSAGIARLQTLFSRHGQEFLVLPNRSQYPLACFFDTLYHLNESCQKEHSMRVAEALSLLPKVSSRGINNPCPQEMCGTSATQIKP